MVTDQGDGLTLGRILGLINKGKQECTKARQYIGLYLPAQIIVLTFYTYLAYCLSLVDYSSFTDTH